MAGHAKEVCINCHFLSKNVRNSPDTTFRSLTNEDRDRIRKGDVAWVIQEHANVECSFRVWSSILPVDPSKFDTAQFIETATATNRKNYCFFWTHRPGMALKAAETLQRIHADQEEAAHDRKLTRWALWVAVMALVCSTIVGIVQIYVSLASGK